MNNLRFVFGLVCGLLGVGLILLVAGQPRGRPVILAPPPTPLPVVIQVDGAVTRPGVYTLPAGSRVRDALHAAGGLVAAADPGDLNQAAMLQDGQRISIAGQTPTAPAPTPSPPTTLRQSASPAAAPAPTRLAKKINLNTATRQELESLPGIGPYYAQRIIDYRQAHGPFKTIRQLLDIDGIGPKTFERIKDLITV